MKYNDQVTYVRNGVNINATVAASRQVEGKEHLTLVYLDPVMESSSMSGSQLERCVSTQFDVAPLEEGGQHGWLPLSIGVVAAGAAVSTDALVALSNKIQTYGPELPSGLDNVVPSASTLIDTLIGRIAEVETQLTQATDTMGELTQKVLDLEKQASKPSAADLDAHAAEQKAAETTKTPSEPAIELPLTDAEKDELADKASAPVPQA